jgi:NOL1/NOP2/fmu family ribosome biogenesis protein
LLIFVSPSEEGEMKGYFANRFGIPMEAFEDFRLLRSGRTVWIAARGRGLEEALHSLKVEAAGVPFLRVRGSMVKPTSRALQLFGQKASRSIIDLQDEAANALLNGAEVLKVFAVEPGYVILRWKGLILGCGHYSPEKLRSLIPLALARNMRGSADPEGLFPDFSGDDLS